MVSEGSAGIEYLNNAISFSTEPIVFEDSKTTTSYNLKEQRKRIREWAKINLVGKDIKSETDRTGELNFVFHYFRISLSEEDSFIVLKEIRKEGKIVFYSIVDKIKNDPGPR
jgi:hypothetical protein